MLDQLLNEAKDLGLYKKLLRVLGGYSDKFPATGVSKLFKDVLDKGMKVIPKDKRAQRVLAKILNSEDSVPAKVQQLLNIRFADLPMDCRPIYKDGKSKQVAFWQVDGKVNDKVLSLLSVDSKSGHWSDVNGSRVSLIDIGTEEKNK
jgi:hypothetical protein